MIISLSNFLFIILLATTVLTILPSINLFPNFQIQANSDENDSSSDDEGDENDSSSDDEGDARNLFAVTETGKTDQEPTDEIKLRLIGPSNPSNNDLFDPSKIAGKLGIFDDPKTIPKQTPEDHTGGDSTGDGSTGDGSTGDVPSTDLDSDLGDIPGGDTSKNIFTHLTTLIAEDLKKSTPEQIAIYPWNDLDNNDVDLAFQYLSNDPINLQKVLSFTSDEGIEKILNSLSLQTFNKILQSFPQEEHLKIINKLNFNNKS